jgi:hypothetical protein
MVLFRASGASAGRKPYLLWKWPSDGRVEQEETCTFLPPSLVVHIPTIEVVEAKKNL